jgi:hypothetical protein
MGLVEDGNEAYNKAMAHKTVFAAGLTSQKIERKFLVPKYGNYFADHHCKPGRAVIQDTAVHPYPVFPNLIRQSGNHFA